MAIVGYVDDIGQVVWSMQIDTVLRVYLHFAVPIDIIVFQYGVELRISILQGPGRIILASVAEIAVYEGVELMFQVLVGGFLCHSARSIVAAICHRHVPKCSVAGVETSHVVQLIHASRESRKAFP